jgi:serine/threonine protein phosphatase PrpC
VVWNVVGTHSKHPAPECTELTLALGDTLVLCSDGLVTATRDEEICQALEQTTSAEAACESLFAYGRQRGFQDDATAIIARFSTTQKATGHMTAEFSTSRGRAEPPADADASQLEATLPKQKSRLSAEETGEGPLPTSG